MRRPAVVAAWLVFSITTLLALTAVALGMVARGRLDVAAAVTAAWMAYAVVGVAISTRRPGDRIGAILLAVGLSAEVLSVTDRLLGFDQSSAVITLSALDPIATWVVPLLLNFWVIAETLLPVLMLLFPTGRPLSRRWGLLVLVAFALLPVGLLTSGVADGPGDSVRLVPLELLFGRDGGAAARDLGRPFFGISQLVLFIAGAASLVARYRRVHGVERQQIKWLAYAALLFAGVSVATAIIFFSPLRVLDPEASMPPAVFGGLPFVIALAAMPVTIGIAILRYQLYDIDVLINRTIVYAALTLLLGAVYVGLVIGTQALLGPLTAGNEIAVAGSTLVVVALFQPLRSRIQRWVDRRFYRSRYDAARTLDSFTTRLRSQVDLDSVRRDVLEVVGTTVQPAHANVWLREISR